jgi:hypothetical protein
MTGPNFDQQEQFDIRTVEAVTGTKRATIRQWETREVYVCDLRRMAPHVLTTFQSPDWPDRLDRAKEVLRKYERGWRSYTLGDLVRISFINALIEAGVPAQAAGRAAMVLVLPEARANSTPSGRELLRLQNPLNDPEAPDEFVLFWPADPQTWPQPTRWGVQKAVQDNPLQFRHGIGGMNWQYINEVLTRAGCHAAVVVNLSAIRRNVLESLETLQS